MVNPNPYRINDKAFVLSKTKYGEADLILKLLSHTGDVYSVIARSALKSKKRFGGGVLEPIHYISLAADRSSTSSDSERLATLTEAKVIDDFIKLKSDYDRLELALHFIKSVAKITREGDAHIETFNLLGHSLKAAETTQNLEVLKLQFNLKLLHVHGVLPPDARFVPYLSASIRAVANLSSVETTNSFNSGVVFSAETTRDEITHLANRISEFNQIHREVEALFQNYVG